MVVSALNDNRGGSPIGDALVALLNSVFRRVVSLTGGVKRPLAGAAGRVFSTGAGALNLLLDRSDGGTGFTVSSCHGGLLLLSGKVQQFQISS